MVNCHEIADNYPEFRAVNVNLQKKMEGLQSENADLRSEQNCAAVERAQMKKRIEMLDQRISSGKSPPQRRNV